MRQCKDCKFWVKSDVVGATEGTCRKYPPVVLTIHGQAGTAWPTVLETEFCFASVKKAKA
jgi:hypothetical protein